MFQINWGALFSFQETSNINENPKLVPRKKNKKYEILKLQKLLKKFISQICSDVQHQATYAIFLISWTTRSDPGFFVQ